MNAEKKKIGPVRKNKKTGLYDIDFQIAGKRIQRRNYPSSEAAWIAVDTMKAVGRAQRDGTAPPPLPAVTLGEALEVANKDETVQRRHLRMFERFVESMGEDFELNRMEEEDWDLFMNRLTKYRRGQPGCLDKTTINNYLGSVRGVLRKIAKPLGLKKWRAPVAPFQRDLEGRERVMHSTEIEKILSACRLPPRKFQRRHELNTTVQWRQEIHDILLLILLTGAREGEIRKLRSIDISWEWRSVNLQSKGGKARTLPLSDLALEILRSRKPKMDTDKFFNITNKNFYRILVEIGEISGVPYGRDVEVGWVVYDFRHTAATEMETYSGTPYSVVSYILGHKRKDMTAKYTHPRDPKKIQAINHLEKYVHGFFTGMDLKNDPKVANMDKY